MQPGMAVNIRGLPLYHLRRHGPTATKEGVSDIMDFFKVTTIIGRKTRLVDYVLDSADPVKSKCISRRHGRVIHKQNNQHYFYDDSMNGIYINNVKIADKVLLQEGDLVTFGHRKGKKFQPGTVIEQPDSEYQFVFEKCNCSHNLLQNEDEEDSRATSDRPISSLHTNTVAEETSCKKKGTEHLYTDTSDEGPSSSETDQDKTTEMNANSIHVPSFPSQNADSEISSKNDKYVVVYSPVSPAQSPYLKDFGLQTSPVYDHEAEVTSQDLISNIEFETEMISQFNAQNPDKSQKHIQSSYNERDETSCSVDHKASLKTRITKSKTKSQKIVEQPSKIYSRDSTVNTSEKSLHNQSLHTSSKSHSQAFVKNISNFNTGLEKKSLMVPSENVVPNLFTSEPNLIDNNKNVSENITRNIKTSDKRNESDFNSALDELQNMLYDSDTGSISNNDNTDFDSLLTELENVDKNNVSENDEKRKMLVFNLVFKFFKYREHYMHHQMPPSVKFLSNTCIKPEEENNHRPNQSCADIKLCENDKHRSAVIKINERNILRTSKKLDDIQYMQEQNENCEAENDEDIDIICIKNDSSKMKTSKHTVKNKDQLKSIDLTDLQNDMNSNQVTEQPELIDPIIPQQDGSGVNSDQDMEPSEDEMSQKSFRKTIQLLIHQELDKNNTDNVMHDNSVLHIPQSEKTESVNDSLLQIHENLARNNTENICNNDGFNSNLLVSVRNSGITERMENVVNGNVGHEIDEVDGSLSSRSDSPEFLFQENPITSVKVKVEDEFTSKCPRKSKVLPNIGNNLIFNVEEDTVKKESFLPITFSDSAEYLSDASSEEFPAAFTVTVGKGRVENIDENGFLKDIHVDETLAGSSAKTEDVTLVKSMEEEFDGRPLTPKSQQKSQIYNSPIRLKISLTQKMKDKIIKQRSDKRFQNYNVQRNNMLMKFRSTNSPVKKMSAKKETEIASGKKQLILQSSEIEIISADSSDTCSNESLKGKTVKRKKKKSHGKENGVKNIGNQQMGVETAGFISTETNFTKEVINRKLEKKKTSDIGKTIKSQRSSVQKKGKPQKRKKRISSKTTENNYSSDWLTNTFPKKLPFVPQLGDKVMYFKQGHQLYLKEVRENSVYQFDSEIFEPWHRHPYLRDQELVRIESIKYEVNPPCLCNLRLAIIDPVTYRTTGESFQVIYHDMPNVIDFLVLKQMYDIAVKRNWKAGDRFCSIIEDSWWTGTVISQEPLHAEYPDSMFQCYKVRWDTGETEALSPWDMEPITETRRPLSVGDGRPVNRTELKNLVYTPESKEWPTHGQVEECERIATAIDTLMKYPVIQSVQTAIVSTKSKVEYPVNLNIICQRLKNHFYRRLNAVKFDINYVQTNAEKSLFGTDELQNIRILTETLLTFISDEKCKDPIPIFRRISNNVLEMASGSNESTQIKKTKKRKFVDNDNKEEQQLTDNSDWIIECSKLLCMINKSFEDAPAVQNNDIWNDPNCQTFESISNKLDNGYYKGPSELHNDVKEVFKIADNFYLKEKSFGMYFMIIGLSGMFEEGMAKIMEKYNSDQSESDVRFEIPYWEKHFEGSKSSQGTSNSILPPLPSCFPAPQKCFKQSKTPPTNEFKLNMKLEAVDVRNPISICIATVVGLIGPRLVLRLDGSDNMNDFWKLVDSSDIHPIGYCNKIGKFVSPPLGFLQDFSNFPQFMADTLRDADITPEHCFKKTPPTPKGNYFEVGMKLEAVDRKNPALICPATIAEVNGDQILLSFDGWQGTFDYWCRYDSRDIFPIGWCKQGGLYVQPPGKKVPKKSPKKNLMKQDTHGTPSKVLRRSTSQDNSRALRHPSSLSRSLIFPCPYRMHDDDGDSSEHAAETSSSSGIDSG